MRALPSNWNVEIVKYFSPEEAIARARRNAEKFAGSFALNMVVDIHTGEVIEEPRVLTKFGEVGKDFQQE